MAHDGFDGDMRHGELIGLRWEDVDLVAGRITVRQNVVNGKVGTPKSGKPREIPLGVEGRTALEEHRHLRGPLVFCSMSGELLGTVDTRLPLWRACKKAGLRQIGWPALRHFASHLVMRRGSLKAVHELLGHSSIQMNAQGDVAENENDRFRGRLGGGDKGDRILLEAQ